MKNNIYENLSDFVAWEVLKYCEGNYRVPHKPKLRNLAYKLHSRVYETSGRGKSNDPILTALFLSGCRAGVVTYSGFRGVIYHGSQRKPGTAGRAGLGAGD